MTGRAMPPGMWAVETNHAVSDVVGSTQMRHLGPAILAKLSEEMLQQACEHYKVA